MVLVAAIDYILMRDVFFVSFNPIQDGRGQKHPPTSYSLVTYTNVKISHRNFLTSQRH